MHLGQVDHGPVLRAMSYRLGRYVVPAADARRLDRPAGESRPRRPQSQGFIDDPPDETGLRDLELGYCFTVTEWRVPGRSVHEV